MPPARPVPPPPAPVELAARLLELLERSAPDRLLTDAQAAELLQVSGQFFRRARGRLVELGAAVVELEAAGDGRRPRRRWSRRSLRALPRSRFGERAGR